MNHPIRGKIKSTNMTLTYDDVRSYGNPTTDQYQPNNSNICSAMNTKIPNFAPGTTMFGVKTMKDSPPLVINTGFEGMSSHLSERPFYKVNTYKKQSYSSFS